MTVLLIGFKHLLEQATNAANITTLYLKFKDVQPRMHTQFTNTEVEKSFAALGARVCVTRDKEHVWEAYDHTIIHFNNTTAK